MADLRSERGRATRDRLIDAARELFGDARLRGDVDRRDPRGRGVKRGALYHHFESKQALFDAVLDRVVAEIAAGGREGRARRDRPGREPARRLRCLAATWRSTRAIQRIAPARPAVGGRLDALARARRAALPRRRAAQPAADRRRRRPPRGRTSTCSPTCSLASVTEAALLIARADDPRAALKRGQAAASTRCSTVSSAPDAAIDASGQMRSARNTRLELGDAARASPHAGPAPQRDHHRALADRAEQQVGERGDRPRLDQPLPRSRARSRSPSSIASRPQARGSAPS